MAETTPSQNPSEIDIDDLEISVLMLVKNRRHHEAAATFLTKRGWPTKIVSSLQTAIKIMTDEKPDFVLVSMNFPHPAVAKLAPLFTQTFKIETLLFVEAMDASTIAQITKEKGHKLTGGPSGPNIQRTLRRILQAKLNPQMAVVEREGLGSATEDGSWNIIQPGITGPATQSSYTFKGEDAHDFSVSQENQKFEKKKKKLSELNLAKENSPTQEESEPELLNILKQMASQESPSHQDKDKDKGKDKDKDKEQSIRDIIAPVGADQTILAIAKQHGKYERLYQVIFKAVEKLGTSPGFLWTGPEIIEDVFIIPVDHPDLHGYLVVHSEEIVRSAKSTFCDLLSDVVAEALVTELQTESQSGFEVGIPKSHFNNWVQGFAEFNISAEYFGTKFSVAFFKTEEALPQIKKSEIKDMLQIGVADLSTEYPLNFKGYLKFDRNKKLLLYLKAGRLFLPEQKGRLISHNIKDICVKEIDEANLKRFLVLSQLQRGLIQALKISA